MLNPTTILMNKNGNFYMDFVCLHVGFFLNSKLKTNECPMKFALASFKVFTCPRWGNQIVKLIGVRVLQVNGLFSFFEKYGSRYCTKLTNNQNRKINKKYETKEMRSYCLFLTAVDKSSSFVVLFKISNLLTHTDFEINWRGTD